MSLRKILKRPFHVSTTSASENDSPDCMSGDNISSQLQKVKIMRDVSLDAIHSAGFQIVELSTYRYSIISVIFPGSVFRSSTILPLDRMVSFNKVSTFIPDAIKASKAGFIIFTILLALVRYGKASSAAARISFEKYDVISGPDRFNVHERATL